MKLINLTDADDDGLIVLNPAIIIAMWEVEDKTIIDVLKGHYGHWDVRESVSRIKELIKTAEEI